MAEGKGGFIEFRLVPQPQYFFVHTQIVLVKLNPCMPSGSILMDENRLTCALFPGTCQLDNPPSARVYGPGNQCFCLFFLIYAQLIITNKSYLCIFLLIFKATSVRKMIQFQFMSLVKLSKVCPTLHKRVSIFMTPNMYTTIIYSIINVMILTQYLKSWYFSMTFLVKHKMVRLHCGFQRFSGVAQSAGLVTYLATKVAQFGNMQLD